jgi:hypothetical protein
MTLAHNSNVGDVYRAGVRKWPLDDSTEGMWFASIPWGPLGRRGEFFRTWRQAMDYANAKVRTARAHNTWIALQNMETR